MLILCEKPSVAKEFARALGCGGKKGHYENGDTVITYCVGHLFELCEPETYNAGFKKWRIEDLPIIPRPWRYEKIAGLTEQAEHVLLLLQKHAGDQILIATDAGREGELIGRIALNEAGITDLSRCRRFWVSEALTDAVIREGIQNAKPLREYDLISRQGFARQHADWLVGINLTRYMSIGNSTVFSVGRVQTALLSVIAGRNDEVARFVPEPYRELEAAVEAGNGTVIKAVLINPETGKTAFREGERKYLESAQAYCRDNPGTEGEAERAEKREKPEKLLNITALQKKAYKMYGYSPDETLKSAQALYEEYQCLSYPRTPSRVMGDNNVDLFREKFNALKGAYPQWSQYADERLINGENKHIFNSAALEDHHALIPLKELPEGVPEKERRVYEIAAQSFFTVCMPDYLYTEKRILLTAGPYKFRAVIREVRQRGFKEPVPGAEGDGEEEGQEVAEFNEKGCRIRGTETVNKKTGARKEFSMDTLLGFMENPRGESGEKLAGLGTPATRAEIIRTLITREYIEEKGKKLYATEKGRFLMGQMGKDEGLRRMADAGQTTEWEKELREDPEGFEGSIARYVRACIKSGPRETYRAESPGRCPICGKEVREGKKNYYCTGYREGCGFGIRKEAAGAAVTAEDARLLLAGRTTGIKNCTSKAGKKFKAAFKLEKDGAVRFIFQEGKPKKTFNGFSGEKGTKRGAR
jgi:DNA topoisomerase-3